MQVVQNGGFDNFSFESLLFSVVQGGISAGMAGTIGDGLMASKLTGFTKLAAGIALHALSGGLQAAVFGGNVWQGAISGAVGHLVGEELNSGASKLLGRATDDLGLLGYFVTGGGTSAAVAYATGGDPMQAFIIGGATAAFNSFLHQGGDEDGMTQYERNQQNPTLAIDAFWGLFGTVADVVEIGYKGLASAGRWLAGKYAARQTVKQVAKVQLLTQFSSSTIDDAVSLTMKQKELHIFANKLHPKPWLTKLATQMGSNQNVIKSALQNANGRILPNAQGVFNTPVNVGGVDFIIRGYIHKGVPVINTMIVPY
jgi:hypothetical protein